MSSFRQCSRGGGAGRVMFKGLSCSWSWEGSVVVGWVCEVLETFCGVWDAVEISSELAFGEAGCCTESTIIPR